MTALSPYPNSVSIFAGGPTGVGAFTAFFLNNTGIPVPNRVRLDLTQSVGISRRVTPARSPIESLLIDNIRVDPIVVQVRGSLSANPLGLVETPLGTLGSQIRRDIRELKKLQAIQAKREPVILVTPTDTFPSMAMSIEETTVGTNKIELTLTFEEVQIVTAASIAGAISAVVEAGAQNTSASGAQSASAITAPSGVGGGLG